MPARKSLLRLETEEVQGEDSYVVMRKPQGLEAFTYMEAAQALKDSQTKDNYWTVIQLMGTLIVEWNWADEKGVALPLPSTDPKVLEEMTLEELQLLANATQSLFVKKPSDTKN